MGGMRSGIIVAPIAVLALLADPVGAQLNTPQQVQRYNRVARGANVTEWHRRLFDEDPKVRLEAVDSLGKEGTEECVKPLLDATADADARVRAKAFDFLGVIGSHKATQVLTQYLFLNAVDRGTKQRILVALSRIRDPDSVAPLTAFAQKVDDDELRCEALYALGEVGDAAALEVVRAYVESEDPHERRIANDAVIKINQRVAAAPNTQPSLLELEKVLGPRRP